MEGGGNKCGRRSEERKVCAVLALKNLPLTTERSSAERHARI